MEPEKILHFYWDLFLAHLCEFYPLNKEFIAQYEMFCRDAARGYRHFTWATNV